MTSSGIQAWRCESTAISVLRIRSEGGAAGGVSDAQLWGERERVT